MHQHMSDPRSVHRLCDSARMSSSLSSFPLLKRILKNAETDRGAAQRDGNLAGSLRYTEVAHNCATGFLTTALRVIEKGHYRFALL